MAAAAVREGGQRQLIEAELRRLRRPGSRRLHAAKERQPLLALVFATLQRLPLDIIVVEASGKGRSAREACLIRLVDRVRAAGASELVLEWFDGEAADRRCIAQHLSQGAVGAGLAYRHADPHSEPMLWAADVVAWAARGEKRWRDQVVMLLSHN